MYSYNWSATFGTDFYTPPNTIDFSSVFGKFKNLSDNAAVFSTVVSILGVYLLALIYVRYLDKKDLLKVKLYNSNLLFKFSKLNLDQKIVGRNSFSWQSTHW